MTFTPPNTFPAEYVTKDGREAVVHFQMPDGAFVGVVGDNLCKWTIEGYGYARLPNFNLRDKPKRIVRWQNKYANGGSSIMCDSRQIADSLSRSDRICVWRMEWDDKDFRNPNIAVEEV